MRPSSARRAAWLRLGMVLTLALCASFAGAAETGARWAAADSTALAGADGAAVEPAGLAVDAFGTRWVTDAARHRLLRYDAAGTFLGEAGALGSDVTQFRRPGAIAPFGATAMAVLDRENRRVLGYDSRGRNPRVLVDLAASALEQELGRIEPVGLACDAGGALLVADADRDRLLVFDFAGAFQRAIGGYGGGAGTFRHLVAVAAGARGECWTLEWLAGGKVKGKGGAPDSVRAAHLRLQHLDAAGASLGSQEWEAPASSQWSLAVSPAGVVAVAGAGRLWCRASASGDERVRTCALASAAPAAVAFTPDAGLLVATPGQLRRYAPGWDGWCEFQSPSR
ncbi:MAG: hypothetical protein U0704_09160 [Candidatus Eisenbacteria bacterium]